MPARRAKAGILWAALAAGLLVCPAAQGWEARVLELPTNDLVYDPVSQRIYASIPSSVGMDGNSIAAIDPRTGRVGKPVWVGSEPNLLAVSDDGSTLWVTLPGSFAVRRVALPALVPGLQFVVRSDVGGEFLVEDLEVQPGDPDVVVVSQFQAAISSYVGLAVYDNGVQRAEVAPSNQPANSIEFTDDPGRLIGIETESTAFRFRRFDIDDAGATLVDSTPDLMGGFFQKIFFAGGRVYSTQGTVVDPDVPERVGIYQGLPGFVRDVVADPAAGHVYFLFHEGIAIYDLASFAKLETIEIPGIRGSPDRMVQWGPGALAFSTDDGQLFFFTLEPLDVDGDGVADRFDNCRGLANKSQADDDRDGVGDPCDTKPGQPDGEVPLCRNELRIALDELAMCWAEPRFVDSDEDGVHDGNDRCPATPMAHPVDEAGCDANQFCAASLDVCERADWRNDEPRGKPDDCVRVGSKKQGYQCWAG